MRTGFPRTARAFLAAAALGPLLSACGGGSSADASPGVTPENGSGEMGPVAMPEEGTGSCSTEDQNAWVYDNMLDYYLFYDQVPIVDPSTFDSPRDLLRAVRFEERDPFSFITAADASDLAFEEGREFGLGYNWGEDGDGVPRITRVITDSPFGRAGIERGDIIVEIAGRPALEALTDRDFFEETVLGTPDAPGDASWTFTRRDSGARLTERFVATEYAIDTVRHVETYANGEYDGVIGYFFFDRFLETSEAEIFDVFAEFAEAGVTDLVLDLRYNRGGRISVARQLATLALDNGQPGAVLQSYRYNDKYAATENFELRVDDELAGLGLRSLVVLATDSTASSSEIVAGGLAPLMNVSVIGPSRTSGKPYIQRGRDRCGERLNAIEAEAFNAAGESVFGGIVPDCHADDDRLSDFGQNPETGVFEGMLLAGLDRVAFGTCELFVEDRARGVGARGEGWTGQGSVATGGALLDGS